MLQNEKTLMCFFSGSFCNSAEHETMEPSRARHFAYIGLHVQGDFNRLVQRGNVQCTGSLLVLGYFENFAISVFKIFVFSSVQKKKSG